MIILAPLFLVTALIYASIGFGGGSTYNALLVLAGTDYRILPAIALLCNLIVVTGGTWRFARAGHIDFKRIWPWIIPSVPMAWIGGQIIISEVFFIGLLGFALCIAGLRLLFPGRLPTNNKPATSPLFVLPATAGTGALLGLLAGMTGIGGGIFLAPVLYFLHWGSPKVIAGTCSIFIFVNSLAGLAGQAAKLSDLNMVSELAAYWPLFPAVLLGGLIGSWLGAARFDPKIIKLLTALLMLYVAIQLLWRWAGLVV